MLFILSMPAALKYMTESQCVENPLGCLRMREVHQGCLVWIVSAFDVLRNY
jgi:hypothetical protein